ncbi:helix-turn-helix domain-containing protein [Paraburkholderia hospita]|uniref:helix-turn-helix domain-containing protein n=1 Tax=Paraburkholderia hospita TaxID=169430 RepID=UPI000271C767|nr:helix-turn-helix domain-containing protein [Paraburkholderia hospita]EUC19547.1 hypothetical protein PMI06_002417 [Burkholderia sp. BT03]
MLGRRIKPKVIAVQLGVSVHSVYKWSHAWRDSGVCGLMGGHNGGRPPALSEDAGPVDSRAPLDLDHGSNQRPVRHLRQAILSHIAKFQAWHFLPPVKTRDP